jgi:hypothetical protein
VRWLSLIDLLESLVKSYKQTKRILINQRQQAKLKNIDEYVLKQLICLLKPFKQVLQLVQAGNSPSLYMVLPYTLSFSGATRVFRPMGKLCLCREKRWAKWVRFLLMGLTKY